MKIIARVVFMLLIAVLAFPFPARGDVGTFSPTVYTFEAELDINAAYESYKNTTRGIGVQTADTYLTEKIVLTSTGFVYHPRFLQYLLKFGGGLSQENFTSNYQSNLGTGAWNNSFIYEYELRALMLPEHPYNLEIFALRRNPFVQANANWAIHPVGTSVGALFTYKERPVVFRIGYTVDSVESGVTKTDTDTLNANAAYTVENFSLAGSYSRSNSQNTTSSMQSEFDTEKYSLHNLITLFDKKFLLLSDASRNSYETQGLQTPQSGDRFTWTEQAIIYFPWNIDVLLNYNHFEDTEKFLLQGASNWSSLTTKNDYASLLVTQKLYESLQWGYGYSFSSADTTTGDFQTATNSLNANYTKVIPRGRFNLSGFLSRSVSERNGAPAFLNDPQRAPIGGTLTLKGTDIDPAFIFVEVKDPFLQVFVPMLEGRDYTPPVQVGDTFKMVILGVPPGVPVQSGDYEFLVTYRLVSEFVKEEETNFGYSLKLELFNGFFGPYYSYSNKSQKILSGQIQGVPENSTNRTVGVVLQGGPYYLIAEYQDYQSNIDPYRQYRGEASYQNDVTPTMYLLMRAFYLKVDYLESLSQPTGSEQTIVGGTVSFQKKIPERNLTITGGGTYSQGKFIFDTMTYSVNAGLLWSVGKLEVGLGASVSRTETEIEFGTQGTTYQNYYLSFKRKLF